MDHHAGSAPPPSPIPPPPDSTAPVMGTPWRAGWHPADDDHGPMATAWRAATALRVARRTEDKLDGLGERLDRLATTIDTWSVTWGERWATAGRILRWAGAIVGALAVAGAAREAWAWVSTLHH